MEDFNYIINNYLQEFETITKEQSDYMHNTLCWHNNNRSGLNLKHFKIVNNQLYKSNKDNFDTWETRIEAFKYMMLRTLSIYKIPDCEFFIFDDDSINNSNINMCVYNKKLLPIIVTTSVLYKYNMILCPDFTFSFFPEAFVKNNEKMCKEIVNDLENVEFNKKINKIVWRGSGNTNYRSQYLKNDENYDITSALTLVTYKGEDGKAHNLINGMTRQEKGKYKFQLYLNGHEGTETNGAYSSSFKWGLMTKSVVFYSAPTKYREFWNHPHIFKENEHFVFSKNSTELHEQLLFYKKNEDISNAIALKSFNFFKKYLLEYDIILSYMNTLLCEYSKRLNYEVKLTDRDILITNIKHNDFINSN
jgi:hypothetical protein